MPITIEPHSASFVARINGLDLRRPLTPDEVRQVEQASYKYAVLIFPQQPIDDEQQVDFALNFGDLEETPQSFDQGRRRLENKHLNDISNLGKDGNILAADDRRRLFNLGDRQWHSDSSFKKVPARYSLLHARSVVPVGGQTEFSDMRSAWDELDPALKERIRDFTAQHSLLYSRARMGFTEFTDDEKIKLAPITQPLVRVHPGSGRTSLFLSAHMGRVNEMPSVIEGMDLIRELEEHATQRERTYAHTWSVGDLVMWDNRCTMHRVRRYDDQKYPRDMRRVTLTDAPRRSAGAVNAPAMSAA